jgi:hypothetical protein
MVASAGDELAVMAIRGGSGVELPWKALSRPMATSTPLVRTIMMSNKMQSNLHSQVAQSAAAKAAHSRWGATLVARK